MPHIDVIDPGFYTTVQDTGRFGFRSQGVPVSGPMDRYAFEEAQKAVGNDVHMASLECTLKGPELLFGGRALVAVCGAPTTITLNGQPVSMNQTFVCVLGDYLQLGQCKTGMRLYMAISGGIQSPQILGSRSFYYPISPQAQLQKGDKLHFNAMVGKDQGHMAFIPRTFDRSKCITVSPGPEWALLSQQEKARIIEGEFTVGSNNRMGYQLQGPILQNTFSLPSSCVLPGVVQLTPNGTLLVAMADAQVTGGYPRILVVMEESRAGLAQMRTGQKIQFRFL